MQPQVGEQSRFCVRGKAGVMDVLNASENAIDLAAGASGKSSRSLKVGPAPCSLLPAPYSRSVLLPAPRSLLLLEKPEGRRPRRGLGHVTATQQPCGRHLTAVQPRV